MPTGAFTVALLTKKSGAHANLPPHRSFTQFFNPPLVPSFSFLCIDKSKALEPRENDTKSTEFAGDPSVAIAVIVHWLKVGTSGAHENLSWTSGTGT